MDWLTAPTPLIIGHRGASADAPENTLAAFGLAVAQGADGIELDVQLSADGWPVIMHDRDVARTTNGSGMVSRLTVAQLRELDAGDGQGAPTLDDLFEMLGPQALYNIELKDFGWRSRGLEAAVADRIEAHHLQNRVLVSSFNPLSVRRARRELPRTTPVGLIRDTGLRRYTYLLADGEADHPHHSLVDEAYMAWARQKGFRVHVWTVDDPAEARRLVALGVHGVITNKPGFIRKQLGL
jgi:glycerophosphoryl diester phosphodiesterase